MLTVDRRSTHEETSTLLARIAEAFARGDEALGHDLIAEAIERYELPTEVVAAALCAGVEAQVGSVRAG